MCGEKIRLKIFKTEMRRFQQNYFYKICGVYEPFLTVLRIENFMTIEYLEETIIHIIPRYII